MLLVSGFSDALAALGIGAEDIDGSDMAWWSILSCHGSRFMGVLLDGETGVFDRAVDFGVGAEDIQGAAVASADGSA